MKATFDEAFTEKWIPEPYSGCWLWTGWVNIQKPNHGYGMIRREGKSTPAHRASYELHVGEIPYGLHVCHKCDTPLCVNPSHLFLGSRSDNQKDSVCKGRYHRKGEDNGFSKLTESDVRKILKSNDSVQSLADDLAVTTRTIYLIKQRKTWNHENV